MLDILLNGWSVRDVLKASQEFKFWSIKLRSRRKAIISIHGTALALVFVVIIVGGASAN